MKHDQLEGLAQALFEECGDALFLFDPDTQQLLDANSTAQRLSGFPLRELLHFSVGQLFRFEGSGGLQPLLSASRKTGVFHPDDQARWAKAFARLRAGQSNQEDYRLLLADGSLRWVHDSVMVSRDKNILRLDGVITDITQRKQAEQDLKEKEERFHSFMNNSPAIAFMKDTEGRLIYHNRPFQRLFQQGEEQLIGKTDFDLFPVEVARKLRENDDVILRANRTIETVERIPTPDGVSRDWLVFKFPFQAGAGRTRIGGVAVDITDRRRSEKI